MSDTLAVLIPVRNGGHYLRNTVLSCGESALLPGDAEVFVLDNCSEDGCTANLPPVLANGLRVYVVRNDRDLGRVGNWNRGLEIARQRGLRFATFLFAGDTWLCGDAIKNLLDLMRESGAELGLGGYLTVNENGERLRASARISMSESLGVCPVEKFVGQMLDRGHMPITPLQANIYRLDTGTELHFEANRPLTTDFDATARFISDSVRKVAISSEPVCAWLARSGRVFCSSGLKEFMADHFPQLQRAESVFGKPLNWSKAKSLFVIGYAMQLRTFGQLRDYPAFLTEAWRHLRNSPGSFNPFDAGNLIWRRLIAGKSSLHFE